MTYTVYNTILCIKNVFLQYFQESYCKGFNIFNS
jgi:hypothetical protein